MAQLELALTALEGRDEWTRAGSREAAARLKEAHPQLLRRVGELADTARGATRIRIHGDLHLGQVLVTAGDVTLIDFEGEPAKPLEARRAKDLPLRDVAGVLRSFDYAAAVALQGWSDSAEGAFARAEALMAAFRRLASRTFLDAYREAGGHVDEGVLDLFLLEKAAYEVAYEAANRPDWLETPLHGLAAAADHLLEAAR